MAEKKSEKSTGEVSVVAELTLKSMGVSGKAAVKAEKNVYMGRVFGEIAGIKAKERRDGSAYTILLGQFRGMREDGAIFESEKMILPGGIMDTLLAQVNAAGGAGVQFAYDITAAPDEKSSVGYKYAVKTLIKTEANDRLAALTETLVGVPVTGGAK